MHFLVDLQRWLYGGSLAELKGMSADPNLLRVSFTLATAAMRPVLRLFHMALVLARYSSTWALRKKMS